jgi:hypothetical protein
LLASFFHGSGYAYILTDMYILGDIFNELIRSPCSKAEAVRFGRMGHSVEKMTRYKKTGDKKDFAEKRHYEQYYYWRVGGQREAAQRYPMRPNVL